MKILVTGGAGFIASNIVDAYIGLGHDVVVVDDLSSGKKHFINKKAGFYEADIRDQKEINKIFEKEHPDIVNHHAAQISVRVSVENPILDAGINIIGILNILEEARKQNVKKIIFASSGGVVYGDAKDIPTPESYLPQKPLSPYGVSKLTSEHYLYYYFQTYKIPYIAFRYSNVYGPRQNPHGEAGVVAIFSKKILKNERPTINGDGLQTRDYVFVGDVVQANKIALNTKVSGSFNIGTGIETNVIEIFNQIKEITGSKLEPAFGQAKAGEQKRSCLDTSYAGKILNWKVGTSLSQGLYKTVEYFKNNE